MVALGDSITRGERTGVKADETFAALPNTKTVTYVSDLLIDTAVLPPAS